jgi:S-DNA-T family DNA segregation ATPase FtsK/SpoIIIE
MSEFIYILENASMPGLVKIGRTERSVSERVNELSSSTGVPTGFIVVKEYAVANSVEAEKLIHERLSDYRVSDNREFFKMEVADAMDIIESILPKPETRRDFEREDELVAKAIPIVVAQGVARPRVLEEMLGISYEEALFVIHTLRGRGVIGQHNESRWVTSPKPAVVSQKPKPITVATTPLIGNYQLPPIDFLQHPDMTVKPTESKEELMANARLLQQTLAQFDIEVSLGDITKGPTITRYELHPAPGVRLEDIGNHSRNLAAALKAGQVNVTSPIPGKGTVGVDVPNAVRTKVTIRDLFESEEWRNTRAKIPIALGTDIYGHPVVADLTEMPHLLVGGSTGSGKSVFLNALIASLLYRFSPDQVRFVMVDPNCIELLPYNALPHLVVPVVSDPMKGILALRWVVNEMEKRFQIFIRVGVRNIGSFNSRPNKKRVPQESELPLTAKKKIVEPGTEGFAVEVDEEIVVPREDDILIPEKLSYVVLIIENVEDLMSAAKADFETALLHLAQNARVTGIHLVLTTRHADENTISDRLKTEIPARIAFRCATRIESRSIIGEAGAEKLSGKGDMLYLPPGSPKLIRAQGAYITDREINSIVEFIAKQARPSYEMEINQQLSKPAAEFGNESGIDEDEDLIQMCIEVIRSEQIASVSLLQRRLRLGYTRAARILDELENRGIVGPSKGAEPRDILIDLDADDYTAPAEQPPIIQPHLIVCGCEHCGGNIEFDANELGDRQEVSVPCPHCGVETPVSVSRAQM